jgi:hypothetical protein
MFYVNGPLTQQNDVTICQILNSMPPPVALQPSTEQVHASTAGISLSVNATTAVIPAGTSGTLTGFSLPYTATGGAAAESAFVSLVDGSGQTLWTGAITVAAGQTITNTVTVTGLRLRFMNGVNLVVASSTIASGIIAPNLYYSVP